MIKKHVIVSVILLLLVNFLALTQANAESCEIVVRTINLQLSAKIDQQELGEIVRSLNSTKNKDLPPKFVTKREATLGGWNPGKDLWSVNALRGSSIGGDRFKNLEGRLPDRKWREADLDYRGGHRGGKRILFSQDGQRFVTVDHYKTFVEVPACR